MKGLMMDQPLLITSIMRHASKFHPEREVVSVTTDNPRHRTNYGEIFQRAHQLANALAALGLSPSDRVGTICWNDYRHIEMYYAISCAGWVCHTINPRLFSEQLEYVINHAEDQVIFVDPLVLPALEQLKGKMPTVRQIVVTTDAAHMPVSELPNLICYEDLIEGQSGQYDWPELDENDASSLCYTSGTTGNPKGVLYSHRSTVLHTLLGGLPDVVGANTLDCVLPVVPMFHVNAWGMPYVCPMIGAKLVMPGPKMGDGETLAQLMNEEQVTVSLGVPTVWLALLQYCEENDIRLESLGRVVVGGAACPVSIMDDFKKQHDIHVQHGWGMTEMSPLGTLNTLKANQLDLPPEERREIQAYQGRGLFGVDMKIVDEDDNELPWDNVAYGRLKVRGNAVCSGYYRLEDSEAHDDKGWFDTGDVGAITPDGFLRITDRTKDVIKSGGEWISSIDLENAVMGHPSVAEAAVIGIPHPRWTERPLLVVVKASEISADELLSWLEDKVAKWWLPDGVAFVQELPHTATGKVSKLNLRKQFADHQLPEVDRHRESSQ
jgi:fatty-acyl-CoA synthase